jgi:Alginate lyase
MLQLYFVAGLKVCLAAQEFRHPGLLHGEPDLVRMRSAIDAGREPWASAWRKFLASPLTTAGWRPRPVPVVIRGGPGDNVATLRIDVARAYQCALRWRLDGSRAHGETARDILNAWAGTIQAVRGNSDRYLAVGICGYQLANAAELMRDHPGVDQEGLRRMFLEVFYRGADSGSAGIERFLYGNVLGGDHNGAHIGNYWANWDLCNLAAAVSIGVFCDRRDIYERALDYLKYGSGNGSMYHVIPYLHPDGLGQWQEAGRDQGHTTLGVGLLAAVAETAWNQGDDLYSWADNRLLRGAEYVAAYNEARREVPYSPYTWLSGTEEVP